MRSMTATVIAWSSAERFAVTTVAGPTYSGEADSVCARAGAASAAAMSISDSFFMESSIRLGLACVDKLLPCRTRINDGVTKRAFAAMNDANQRTDRPGADTQR